FQRRVRRRLSAVGSLQAKNDAKARTARFADTNSETDDHWRKWLPLKLPPRTVGPRRRYLAIIVRCGSRFSRVRSAPPLDIQSRCEISPSLGPLRILAVNVMRLERPYRIDG